ncbi:MULTISPECIES: SDR family NAD(P)-dependent oxidoreductase [Pandoraea]|uniref:SDR family NAD(P)-dependent oxidoreductase n=1 Tax=Pandoraea TaxID=93217 RepID=UPI001F5C14ED|nr:MULTISPECIES: SDR family NAD(P)-dependent oxidoreductase [Pandoraea]MCI3207944.1 3-oxoacyl-ACP reductase [Pandoraea sp. LA3]MDN4585973.1 3-oxoacyl-ACP reductase [Pandoraea capi]
MSKSNRTVIITGATSGIGLGLAQAFLRDGYNVVGTGRSGARLEQTAALLAAGERFLPVAGDVADPAAAETAFKKAIEVYGHVDVLINNAGIFAAKPFVDFTPEEIETQIATNLKGTLYFSQAAARHMTARRSGRIVNVTASIAIQASSGVPALLAAVLKGGMNQATKALALELAPFGVTVNAVAPGVVNTPMHAPETHDALGQMHPLGRIAEVEDVAQAVRYLVDNDYVTGTILPVDGGYAAGR